MVIAGLSIFLIRFEVIPTWPPNHCCTYVFILVDTGLVCLLTPMYVQINIMRSIIVIILTFNVTVISPKVIIAHLICRTIWIYWQTHLSVWVNAVFARNHRVLTTLPDSEYIDKNGGVSGVIVGVGSVESSFLVQSTPCITGATLDRFKHIFRFFRTYLTENFACEK